MKKENIIKTIKAIEKLPKEHQASAFTALRDKVNLLKAKKEQDIQHAKDLEVGLDTLLVMLNETGKISHLQLIDNDSDVHPQYLTAERFDDKVKTVIENIDKDLKRLAGAAGEHGKRLETIKSELSSTLKELSAVSTKDKTKFEKSLSEIETKCLKLSKKLEGVIELSENDKSSAKSLSDDISNILIRLDNVALKSEIPPRVEVVAGTDNVMVAREFDKRINLERYTIAVKPTLIRGGGGGPILDQVYGRLDSLAAGVSILAAGISATESSSVDGIARAGVSATYRYGQSNYVLRTGDTMSGDYTLGGTLNLAYGNTTLPTGIASQLNSGELGFKMSLWNGVGPTDHYYRFQAIVRPGATLGSDFNMSYDSTSLWTTNNTGQFVALGGLMSSKADTSTVISVANGSVAIPKATVNNTNGTTNNFSVYGARNAASIEDGYIAFRHLNHNASGSQSGDISFWTYQGGSLNSVALIGSSNIFGFGIGITAPYGFVHFGNTANASTSRVVLQNLSPTTNAGFDLEFMASSTDVAQARIRHQRTDAVSAADSDMVFYTYNGASAAGNYGTTGLNEVMRLKHNGRIGIGVTTKLARFTVAGATFYTGIGTVSGNSGTALVGGVNTQFLQDLMPGGRITIGVDTRNIKSIESGTSLTLQTNLTATTAGTSFTHIPMVWQSVDINGTPFAGINDQGQMIIGRTAMIPFTTGNPAQTSSPALTLYSNTTGGANVLALQNFNGTNNAEARLVMSVSASDQPSVLGMVSTIRTNQFTSGDADVAIQTNWAAASPTLQERIRIKYNGNIGFGQGLSNALSLIHFNTGTSIGGMRVGTRRVSATGNINLFDYYVGATTGVSMSLTLPQGSSAIDSQFIVQDESGTAASKVVTILTVAGDLINGTSFISLNTNYGRKTIIGASGMYFSA